VQGLERRAVRVEWMGMVEGTSECRIARALLGLYGLGLGLGQVCPKLVVCVRAHSGMGTKVPEVFSGFHKIQSTNYRSHDELNFLHLGSST
jgi:hypothetical protein